MFFLWGLVLLFVADVLRVLGGFLVILCLF